MSIIDEIKDGNRLALARILSQIENGTEEGLKTQDKLFKYTGNAHLIGVTGAPGTGKSTLVSQITRLYRSDSDGRASKKVAIVAVDPSSPFTGGAILGDRVRMRDLAGDPGVFIRSMATRGSLGGLANATASVVQVLDAAGFDIVLIETIGAGQAEVDIARLAHTTLVIEAPGFGDDIQAIKAGILEIADILVLNKSDLPGAESARRALDSMLRLSHPTPHIFLDLDSQITAHHPELSYQPERGIETDVDIWIPPILSAIATTGDGISEIVNSIDKHFEYLKSTGELSNREKLRFHSELTSRLQNELIERWKLSINSNDYPEILEKVVKRELSPYRAVLKLLKGSAL